MTMAALKLERFAAAPHGAVAVPITPADLALARQQGFEAGIAHAHHREAEALRDGIAVMNRSVAELDRAVAAARAELAASYRPLIAAAIGALAEATCADRLTLALSRALQGLLSDHQAHSIRLICDPAQEAAVRAAAAGCDGVAISVTKGAAPQLLLEGGRLVFDPEQAAQEIITIVDQALKPKGHAE
ncbi:hypothetical protein [Paracoccus pacificus]|uniref:Flagellar assembly protein FliH n=1 Tax=Paracoccus pacificus TaxID=1463598 RepID=A0ABW4RC41_9RHOB